jgi:hypothetical protein
MTGKLSLFPTRLLGRKFFEKLIFNYLKGIGYLIFKNKVKKVIG